MSQSGKMKIAVCFSGQLRTWRKCIDSWYNAILSADDDNFETDVFCHIWDFNSLPNPVSFKNGQVVDSIVDSKEIQEFISIIKPKSFLIEPQRTSFNEKQMSVLTSPSFLSQYYGIMKAARLKKEYEINNNFMYDVVVRSRYDSLYLTKIKTQYFKTGRNVMQGFHFGWDNIWNRGRMGDICWMADSMTYDILADYYLNLGNLKIAMPGDQPPTPENVFFHYIKKCNINISMNHWDIKLFRESQDHAFSKDKSGYETW